ncbi:hypothetical protein B4096_0543 [Heyndrickxia coagulans]|nr:hypothetical protein CIW84_13830 [Heyndrickxia coagulans]KYC79716.1 hypothetical protein B4096_0543 [Heyndrickxia coagulans]
MMQCLEALQVPASKIAVARKNGRGFAKSRVAIKAGFANVSSSVDPGSSPVPGCSTCLVQSGGPHKAGAACI